MERRYFRFRKLRGGGAGRRTGPGIEVMAAEELAFCQAA